MKYLEAKSFQKNQIREVMQNFHPVPLTEDDYQIIFKKLEEYNPFEVDPIENPWILKNSINRNKVVHLAIDSSENDVSERFYFDSKLNGSSIWCESVCNLLSHEMFVLNARFLESRYFKYELDGKVYELLTEDVDNKNVYSKSYSPWNVVSTSFPKDIWVDVETILKCRNDEYPRLWEFQKMLREISVFDDEKLSRFASILSFTLWEDAYYRIVHEQA